jgi:hypothetical protein
MHDAPLASWQWKVASAPTPIEKSMPDGTVTVVPVHSFPDHCVGLLLV